MIKNKKILLIITGSVASYKALDMIRLLQINGAEVNVIMTESAKKFITPLMVSAISGKDIYDDLFCEKSGGMDHIKLSRDHDVIIISPASANFIAKINNGICDDLASAVLKANNGKPVFIAPAMNVEMWKKNKKNITKLKQQNINIIEPQSGQLACGEVGQGKMADIAEIFQKITEFFAIKKHFTGKKIIITAGATFEKIDPVRFIGNFSSGKQGVEIAQKIFQLDGDVLLIAANVKDEIALPEKNIIRVQNTVEILANVENNLKNCDIFISVAAVSDFIPVEASEQKIKKEQMEQMEIKLKKNIDVLKTIAISKNRPKIIVGFAAESENLLENAQKKLVAKNCDF
ncbi:bifunctional phosphopantothenoylcysteine decarboxylase/phosphopantothenate--cysteine ligase CoaBC, partial [Flavobacteriaceae bacterium]|nr:bifunctional phosphopantothenoylcysteine decarboxylase/phosphopantothenate--cysteine ligase CoaBC [Flavobacteriaceae bacterium]